MNFKIKVKIKDIKVEKKYFEFKYTVIINERVFYKKQIYSGKHNWIHNDEFEKFLKEEYAMKLILNKIAEK